MFMKFPRIKITKVLFARRRITGLEWKLTVPHGTLQSRNSSEEKAYLGLTACQGIWGRLVGTNPLCSTTLLCRALFLWCGQNREFHTFERVSHLWKSLTWGHLISIKVFFIQQAKSYEYEASLNPCLSSQIR